MMTGMLTQIFKEVKNSNANVGKFIREFKKNGPFSLEVDSREAYASIVYYQKELFKLLESGKSLNELEDLFELPLTMNMAVNEVQVRIINKLFHQIIANFSFAYSISFCSAPLCLL